MRARTRNAATDKALSGRGCGWGPGARAPPARGAAAGRGAAKGGMDARAPGPRRRRRHFVSSAQWGKSNGRARERGWRERNEPVAGREDWSEAGSAGRLQPCHRDPLAGPALREGGGAEVGAVPATATLALTLSAAASRTAAVTTLLPQPVGVSPQKPRGAHRAAESNCNGEKRRRSRGRGRAGGRARAREVGGHVTGRSPAPCRRVAARAGPVQGGETEKKEVGPSHVTYT